MKYLNNKSILFCYGKGGHSTQMKRLAPNILKEIKCFDIITFSDEKSTPSWSTFHYHTNEFRSKYARFSLLPSIGLFSIISDLIKIIRKHNIKVCISTGPGLAIPTAIIIKLFGGKVIHIETWSRFHSKSLTGRVLYYLADVFYVQNKCLLKLYPNAIYAGLL